ncbi:ATP-dependent nuclease [Leptospira harrisiae]|uniref:ATP-dependent nuclease n=1 Tax=Leptospira harrisiae TaxID=2023189 RepID=UPI000C296A33|nr:AAA family ATPase [Leptospira harrisiae]PKA09996.1 hypothetical protein CH366_10070 [Leptospira harrisiae]
MKKSKNSIQKVTLRNIRSFKNTEIILEKSDLIIVGQNDHGKSSILKILDALFNKLDKTFFQKEQALPESVYKILNPAFAIGNQAKKIIIEDLNNQKLFITIREGSISVSKREKMRGFKSDKAVITLLFNLIENTEFVYIPSFRDASSETYVSLFKKLMDDKGLKEIIPKVGGGTRKEYRLLRTMREQLEMEITPYLDKNILPEIKRNLVIDLPYDLKIAFQVNLEQMIKWINQSINLGVKINEDSEIVSITEIGSGIQSLLLLAIQRLGILSSEKSSMSFYLAIEEPEAFLHPQMQRIIGRKIIDEITNKKNIKLIITTHSPYILNLFSIEKIILVKKNELGISSLYYPNITGKDIEILNSFNDELNSEIFYSNAVLFVEGISDKKVLYRLLQNIHSIYKGQINIIDTGGNKNFSPYLKLMKTLDEAKIPWGVVTDFDSFLSSSERAAFKGFENADIKISSNEIDRLTKKIDSIINKSESEYIEATKEISKAYKSIGVNLFVFPSDLEYSLCSNSIINEIVSEIKKYERIDLKGHTVDEIRTKIGSKGIPIGKKNEDLKKSYLHEKIANIYNKDQTQLHPSMKDCLDFVKRLITNVV